MSAAGRGSGDECGVSLQVNEPANLIQYLYIYTVIGQEPNFIAGETERLPPGYRNDQRPSTEYRDPPGNNCESISASSSTCQ